MAAGEPRGSSRTTQGTGFSRGSTFGTPRTHRIRKNWTSPNPRQDSANIPPLLMPNHATPSSGSGVPASRWQTGSLLPSMVADHPGSLDFTVCEGLCLGARGPPCPEAPSSEPRSHERAIDLEVLELRRRRALSRVQGQFLSSIFTVPKKDGSRRLVVN